MSGQRKRHRSNNVLPLTTTMMMDVISNAASKNTILTTAATSSSSKWKLTPLSILIRMMAYMDNGTLMIMCLVCKQVKDLIWHGTGMENKLVRIFECSPSSETKIQNSSLAAARRFAINMDRYCQDGTKHRILQGYQQLKVYNVGRLHVGSAMMMGTGEARELTQNVRLNGIITLNIIPSSLPRNTIYEHEEAWDLIYVLSCIVPNLRHLNLSTALITTDILENFSVRCPLLETIKWNDNTNYSFVANGNHLRLMNTLRELHLDNYNFWFDQYDDEYGRSARTDSKCSFERNYHIKYYSIVVTQKYYLWTWRSLGPHICAFVYRTKFTTLESLNGADNHGYSWKLFSAMSSSWNNQVEWQY